MQSETYTRMYDDLVKQFGRDAALIYGILERHATYSNGQLRCQMSKQEIGKRMDLSERAVLYKLRPLLESGHLEIVERQSQGGHANVYLLRRYGRETGRKLVGTCLPGFEVAAS